VRTLANLSKFDEDLIRRELGLAANRGFAPRRAPVLNRFTSRSLEEQALAMLLQKPALAALIDAELVDFCRQELRDGLTLLEVGTVIQAQPPVSTAALLERWRDDPLEDQLAALAALDLGIPDSAFESPVRRRPGAAARQGRGTALRAHQAIPFEQWTEEQRDIVRNYKRAK
jgi:DNA primase